MENNYPIIVKSYDFTLWYMKKLEKIPKNHRYTIGEKIQNECLNLLILYVEAVYSKNKIDMLQEANRVIEKLRVLTRLSTDLEILSKDNKKYILRNLNEIGAMSGGWIKSIKR